MPATAKNLAIQAEKDAVRSRIVQLQADILTHSNRPPPVVLTGDARLAVHWRETAIEARQQTFVICSLGKRITLGKMKSRAEQLEALLLQITNPSLPA